MNTQKSSECNETNHKNTNDNDNLAFVIIFIVS